MRSRLQVANGWVGVMAIVLGLGSSPNAQAELALGLGRTLYVQPSSNQHQACADLVAVLESIQDASALVRYSVRLGPGIFNCWDEPLVIPEYVSLFGEGTQTTEIRGVVDSPYIGVVHLQGNSELGQLTVRHIGGAPSSGKVAISIFTLGMSTNGVYLSDVRALAPSTETALYASSATIEANHLVASALVELDAGLAYFRFSLLSQGVSKTSDASASCRFSIGQSNAELPSSCVYPE